MARRTQLTKGFYHSTHSRFLKATGRGIPTLLVSNGDELVPGTCPQCQSDAVLMEKGLAGSCSNVVCSLRWVNLAGTYHFWVPPFSNLYSATVRANKRPSGRDRVVVRTGRVKGGPDPMAGYKAVITFQSESADDVVTEFEGEDKSGVMRRARRHIRSYGLSIRDAEVTENEKATESQVVFDLDELGVELPDDEEEEEDED